MCQPLIQWRQQGSGRFYQVYLDKDLFNYWKVIKVWGSVNSRLGSWDYDAFESEQQALSYIEEIKKRRTAHKYEVIG